MDKTEYFNNLVVRLEELFFHELSDCAAWKTEMIGVDFIQSANITGSTPEEIIESCIREITKAGLASEITYSISGKGILLRMNVKDCIHIPKETTIKAHGVEPYNCPIANMIRDQLIEKLQYETTYVASMDTDEAAKECALQVAIYETSDKIGEVTDWSNE
ncbi:MAG TPA: hypothetical protein PLM29_13170 [Deltaproteobacteria bacterium]|nr:hypothetical protein [Deltaproteobacteria bacterium]HPR53483.1 hypothetical protein [Deltaproteobacteria bacterium]